MLQRLFTLATLIVTILWLVVSYLPGAQALLPAIAFRGSGRSFSVLGVVSLVVFIAIQLWLVYTTVGTVRAYSAKNNNSPFRIKVGTELLWTVLPILMTVALAWASYALWLNLTKP